MIIEKKSGIKEIIKLGTNIANSEGDSLVDSINKRIIQISEVPKPKRDEENYNFGGLYKEGENPYNSIYWNVKRLNAKLGSQLLESIGLTNLEEQIPLFKSPGSIVCINPQGDINASYFDLTQALIHSDIPSTVSLEYGKNILKFMPIVKGYHSRLVSKILSSPKTVDSQAYLNKSSINSYRGAYIYESTGDISSASGVMLSEIIVEKILNFYFPEETIETIAGKLDIKKSDLLAGIGDEMLATLVLNRFVHWGRNIGEIGEDIKNHCRNGDLDKLSLLC